MRDDAGRKVPVQKGFRSSHRFGRFGPTLILLLTLPTLVLIPLGGIGVLLLVPLVLAVSYTLGPRGPIGSFSYPDTNRCRACDYPIHDVRPDAEGHRICPECGAAWKLDLSASEPPA